MQDIKVSICCITYNHEKYIEDAIKGFLMQETNFDFEIIIGEDCSTDRTASLVMKYKEKYPDKIRIVTSETNVGMKENSMRVLKSVRGKYIAFCEGDDRWLDPYKLQKQVNFMDANSEYSMCGHITAINNVEIDQIVGKIGEDEYSKEIIIDDFIRGVVFHNSSVLFRKSCIENEKGDFYFPDYFLNSPVGDYAIQLYLFTKGKVYCFNEIMSQYNWNLSNSWTSTQFNVFSKKIELHNRVIEMFKNFNRENDAAYDRFIEAAIEFRLEMIDGMKENLLNPKTIDHVFSIPNLNKQNIYIFGAGAFGKSIAKKLLMADKKVGGFIDNNLKLMGKEIMGIEVFNLSKITQDSLILICSQWSKDISKQLDDGGYHNYYKLIHWL